MKTKHKGLPVGRPVLPSPRLRRVRGVKMTTTTTNKKNESESESRGECTESGEIVALEPRISRANEIDDLCFVIIISARESGVWGLGSQTTRKFVSRLESGVWHGTSSLRSIETSPR